MKQDRPSYKVYRAHLYRQYFGRSLSAKPITGKHGERYAILKSTTYKLLWIIFIPSVFIITFTNGIQFGFIPLLGALGLYFIVSMIRCFFADFVKLGDSEFISYEMCDNALKSNRPEFSAYLKYIFVPTRSRYTHLIKDSDGREYYPVHTPRYSSEIFFFCGLTYLMFRVGLVMGTGFFLLALLAYIGLMLLLPVLFLYVQRFKSTDNQDETLLRDGESSSVLYKIVSGIFIGGALVAYALVFIFITMGSYGGDKINLAHPPTIGQAYDNALEYNTEHFGKADLVGFYIEYYDMSAMQSGEPKSWQLTFQNTPGLLPRPNDTFEFKNDENNDNIIEVYHNTYETITPAYDAELVTDSSEILAMIRNENGELSDFDIKYITISPVDFSFFRIHNPDECLIDIECVHENMKYIVNTKDKTVYLE